MLTSSIFDALRLGIYFSEYMSAVSSFCEFGSTACLLRDEVRFTEALFSALQSHTMLQRPKWSVTILCKGAKHYKALLQLRR